MIFFVAHFNDLEEAKQMLDAYGLTEKEVLFCGSCSSAITINTTIPYHPLFVTTIPTSIAQQHQYIDAMCRAIQMEVPSKLIFHAPTQLDSATVLARIKEHAGFVGVKIEE